MITDYKNIQECIEPLSSMWINEKLIGFNGKLQYKLSNPLEDGIENVKVTFVDGVPTVEVGEHEQPDGTIFFKAIDFLGFLNGTFDAPKAFVKKEVSVSGSQKFLTKIYKAMID